MKLKERLEKLEAEYESYQKKLTELYNGRVKSYERNMGEVYQVTRRLSQIEGAMQTLRELIKDDPSEQDSNKDAPQAEATSPHVQPS